MSSGNIDTFGYCTPLSGMIFIGWITYTWAEPIEVDSVEVVFYNRSVVTEAELSTFGRDDVRKVGNGIVGLVNCEVRAGEKLQCVKIVAGGVTFELNASSPCLNLDETPLHSQLSMLVERIRQNPFRTKLKESLTRKNFNGEDTLRSEEEHVYIEIDKNYLIPDSGYVLVGWLFDPLQRIKNVRVCCGRKFTTIDLRSVVRIRRDDVSKAFSGKFEVLSEYLGFIAYAPDVFEIGKECYLEVLLDGGSIEFRKIKQGVQAGMGAIKDLLSLFYLRREELQRGFDCIIGPAVGNMYVSQRRRTIDITPVVFGVPNKSPKVSLVIPLYGRIDFMEFQLALFANSDMDSNEILYVLDDPSKVAETLALAGSCFARFGRAFTVLLLSANVGYGPANNIGLKRARGKYVCFLNSDVFPASQDWLERLIETVDDEQVGVVGALLTYEDETIQHLGCSFEPISEFANWLFVDHPKKGMLWDRDPICSQVEALTGACMVMTRDLAEKLNGFDESYIIGDFEDVDLCLRIRDLGFLCKVDRRAHLYHLERQSQGESQLWRTNLTLYNAWCFQKRWAQDSLILSFSHLRG